jgi:hypothetical protein
VARSGGAAVVAPEWRKIAARSSSFARWAGEWIVFASRKSGIYGTSAPPTQGLIRIRNYGVPSGRTGGRESLMFHVEHVHIGREGQGTATTVE